MNATLLLLQVALRAHPKSPACTDMSSEYADQMEVGIGDNDYNVLVEPDGNLSVQLLTESYDDTITILNGATYVETLTLFKALLR